MDAYLFKHLTYGIFMTHDLYIFSDAYSNNNLELGRRVIYKEKPHIRVNKTASSESEQLFKCAFFKDKTHDTAHIQINQSQRKHNPFNTKFPGCF